MADRAENEREVGIERLEQRITQLEKLVRDSASMISTLQRTVELVLIETHAQRRQLRALDGNGEQRWSPGGFPIVERNLPVRFAAHDGNNVYLAHGWWNPEGWGVWGRDEKQVLHFAIENYAGGYIDVHLTLRGFAAVNEDRPTVDFIANGYFLGSHRLPSEPRVLRVRMPPSCIGEGDISLCMAISRAWSPLEAGIGEDRRALGVGLVAIDVG